MATDSSNSTALSISYSENEFNYVFSDDESENTAGATATGSGTPDTERGKRASQNWDQTQLICVVQTVRELQCHTRGEKDSAWVTVADKLFISYGVRRKPTAVREQYVKFVSALRTLIRLFNLEQKVY